MKQVATVVLPARARDWAGHKLGHVSVVRPVGFTARKEPLWECLCDCGTVSVKSAKHFDTLRFCGYRCPLKVDHHRAQIATHGLTGTPLYRIYYNMKRRCLDSADPQYKDYGGRGVSLCPRWEDPELFVKDMGPSYQEGLSIDRIDVDGDYSPENCRWVPLPQQQWNKRNSRFTEEQYLQICQVGLTPQLVWNRLQRGWSFEKSIQVPKMEYLSKEDAVLYRSHGLSSATVNARLRRGWPKEKALTTPSLTLRKSYEKTQTLR